MSASSPSGSQGGVSGAPTVVARIARGDLDAFARFYDRLAPVVNGVLRRRGLGEQAAAVVLEDFFVRIWVEAPRARRAGSSDAEWVIARMDAMLQGLDLDARPPA